MSVPIVKTAFVTGEVAPSLFGHVDLARFQSAASSMRNFFVSYRGGAYSRAGTAFVGFSKQTGRNYPPRLITFQFNINEGLALEFGNQYMRVISDGAYVLEPGLSITGITNANPGVVSVSLQSATGATADTSGVTSTYNTGDTVTMAGGTFVAPAVLEVASTQLASIAVNNPGNTSIGGGYRGYSAGNTITLGGGTSSVSAKIVVATTKVINASAVNNPGTGGTPGPATVTGTTGTGTKFQANVTIGSGGGITAINSITVPGSYTVNPRFLGSPFFAYVDPVTGGGLTGAQFAVQMGIETVNVLTPGTFTVNPAGGVMTQVVNSGAGLSATFNAAVFGPNALTVQTPGNYSVIPTNPVSQSATSGTGSGATYDLTFGASSSFDTGDWVFLSGIGGMTDLNGDIFVITSLSGMTFSLADVYGNPVDTSTFPAYTSGGIAQRIFTLPTPYAEADLPWLKYTQSADVMSICCVNQITNVEYPAQDLARVTDTNWVFTPIVAEPSVSPPASESAIATATGTVNYEYVVTAISPIDGTESVASQIASISNAVDIANVAGSVTITWAPVATVQGYNIYKATPGYTVPIPAGVLFGYAGTAYGTQFQDNNIVADATQVPPLHKDPFSRGQILSASPVTGGSGYTTIGTTITTSTGSGAIITPVLVNGSLSALIIVDAGGGYAATDTITITGNGTGATASINVGPQTGTYPSTVSYIQQRRVYANSLNNPDTYWMSQPGSYTNFDSRIPTIASDAITGTPWAVEVNGIQFMVPMPGGLVILTGLSAWQLTGAGGSSLNPQPITPSTQQAQPQAYNGCSATVPPIRVDQEILYVQAKGSIYRDLSYNYFINIYTGADITENSSHLFTGFQILEHAWCEEPYKVLWSVRNDGTMLSLTYLKSEQVQGWARHDTLGAFKTVCSVTEPPVDALYVGVQRPIGSQSAYTIERMDNRIWGAIEDSWCVDCGASLPQPAPDASLTSSSANGHGAITGATSLIGGTGYSSSTTAVVVDNNGKGSGTGAVPTLTVVGGVITAVTFASGHQGSGYTFPALVITDPANTGSGASAILTLDNSATFTADASVFSAGNVGEVIRMGGGIATVTSYIGPTQVVGNITVPIAATIPNSDDVVQTQPAGSWTITQPTTTIAGFKYLAGATVTGIADGNPIPPQVVPASGVITLPTAASSATIGLGFKAQLQSVYLDAGSPTVQGQRKKISAVTARLEASRGLMIGSNQIDGSTLSPPRLVARWQGLDNVEDHAVTPYNSGTEPLYTGDTRIPVTGGFATPGQVAIQQSLPLPANVLAFVSEILAGDLPENSAPQKQQQRAS